MIEDAKELLDKHGIHYIESGNSLKCLCLNPTHNDRNIGSFSIDKSTGLAYCFSCGFKGNIYTLNKILGEGFTDKDFKEYKFTKRLRPEKPQVIEYPDYKIIGRLLNPFDNGKVMEFLKSIGVYSEDFIRNYGIKYTVYSEMIAENLYGNPDTPYTKMRDRLCIPIFHNGKRINMECRTMTGEIPKVKYVRGCSMQTLFNFNRIDKTKPVVLTESIKNLCKIWNVYPNVIAMFHAIPSDTQTEMLNQCKSIIYFADNDSGSFGKMENGKFKKGGLQALAENYKGNLSLCWDSRTYTRLNKETGVMEKKGYDANDCTLDEISDHIDKAVSYGEYAKQKPRKIFW